MLTRSQVFEHIEICCIIGSSFCVLGGVATVGLSAFNDAIPPIPLMGIFASGACFFLSLLYLFRAFNRHTTSQSSDLKKAS